MAGEGLELPWWPPEPPIRSPREPLSRAAIVAGAIRVIDREGLEGLSMRGLADELGVAAASAVYRHVRGKDELLVLVVDALAGDVNDRYVAEPGMTWRERSAAFARAVRSVVREEHPRAASLFMRRMGLGPNVLAGMDLLLAALGEAGLSGGTLYRAYWALLTYAYGASIREAATALSGAGPGAEAAGLAAALPADLFPHVAAVAEAMGSERAEGLFEYGLMRLLDGIERGATEGTGHDDRPA